MPYYSSRVRNFKSKYGAQILSYCLQLLPAWFLGKNLEFEMGPFLRNERFRSESIFSISFTTVVARNLTQQKGTFKIKLECSGFAFWIRT